MFIIDFLNLNLWAYLIFWAKNSVEYVSGSFGAKEGAYKYGKIGMVQDSLVGDKLWCQMIW